MSPDICHSLGKILQPLFVSTKYGLYLVSESFLEKGGYLKISWKQLKKISQSFSHFDLDLDTSNRPLGRPLKNAYNTSKRSVLDRDTPPSPAEAGYGG